MKTKEVKKIPLVLFDENLVGQFKEGLGDIKYRRLREVLEVPKIVKVEWKDATTMNDVLSIEDAKEQKLVDAETIGYLIFEDEEKTIISSFVFVDNENMKLYPKSLHIIPTKTIKNIIEL